MPRRTCHLIWSLVLILATGLVYWNSLPGAFHFDDYALLLENPHVSGQQFRYADFLEEYSGRPLTLWTFHLDLRLFGADPMAFHLLNLALHVLAVLLLFSLLFALSGQSFSAGLAAFIFALHPLQTQAVNYIWSRSVLLMTVFGLLSLLLARRFPKLSLLSFQLSIWSRVSGLVFALPLILRRREQWKPVSALAALNLAGFAYGLVRYAPRQVFWRDADALSYWKTQSIAFWKYLGLMLCPTHLHLDYSFPEPSTLLFWAGCLGLAGAVAVAWKVRARFPFPACGFLGMVVALSPSLLIPNTDFFNESRAYLALAGFAVAAAWMLAGSSSGLSTRRRWLVIPLGALLLLAMVPVTLQRNQVWQSDVRLWRDSAEKSPGNARAYYNLGVALTREGRTSQAQSCFLQALGLNPRDDFSYAALGYCAEVRGNWLEARRCYRRARELNPNSRYAAEGIHRINKRLSQTTS